jgi:hypothetical protein
MSSLTASNASWMEGALVAGLFSGRLNTILPTRAGDPQAKDTRRVARLGVEQMSGSPTAGHTGPRPSRPFAALVQDASKRHDVDANLLHAVIEVESGYRVHAHSPRGAIGLMQLMPLTVEQYGLKDPFDPRENINAGARHLRLLLDKFDVAGALAAYNAGEGAVRRFGGVPPYPETRRHVRRVLNLVTRVKGLESKETGLDHPAIGRSGRAIRADRAAASPAGSDS